LPRKSISRSVELQANKAATRSHSMAAIVARLSQITESKPHPGQIRRIARASQIMRASRDGRGRNRTLAGLMRALLRSRSQHFRRINNGCFAAGLPLFGDMDQPPQRLHLGQPASKCSHTGDRPARSGPGWFKWERSPAHFVAFPKETRPTHCPALQAAALVQGRHTRLIPRNRPEESGSALAFPQHRPAMPPAHMKCFTYEETSHSEMFDLSVTPTNSDGRLGCAERVSKRRRLHFA
jgi:hypothetical protein